ncbi:hypothetical protein BV898_09732 [Hypsibius exemplaris]|uniref:Cadherin domain-containing protein n=1 Tax=Hypsibius exemplaris TaxID=2072580 RepID=A0A1W0WLK4_HYPEX|nr:hypothetical protein BV898_09732 [Hypsibius exemplaris]
MFSIRDILRFILTSGCLLLVSTTNNSNLKKNENGRRLFKRQTIGTAPTFSQSSYTFTPASCATGTTVGSVSSSGISGTTTYTIAPESVQGYYVTVNSITGLISMVTTAPTTFSFNIRASNTAGTVMVPVTVSCNSGYGTNQLICPSVGVCYTTGTTNTNLYNPYGTYNTYGTYNPYTTNTYNPYGTNTYNPYNTNTYNPYSNYNPYSTNTYNPYGTGYGSGYGQQTLTGYNCNQGAIVGYVNAGQYGQVSGYFISSGQYSINANTGQISLATNAGGGQSTVLVLAYTTSGQSITIPVTISLQCNGQFG